MDERKEIKVGIAEWQVARAPFRLVTLGLGSCVGIAVYDPKNLLGGLAHIMLPDSTQFPNGDRRAKFADLALLDMINTLLRRGAKEGCLLAKIAGGAQMFSSPDKKLPLLNIGERNTAMVKHKLQELGIPLVASDTGGNYGRTMIFDLLTGQVYIRSIGRPLKII